MKLNNKASPQSGFTLIELLVALALAAVLTTAVTRIMLGNTNTVKTTDAYAKVQESARLSLDMLSRDLRMAGFGGCANTMDLERTQIQLDMAGVSGDQLLLHDYAKRFQMIDNYSGSPALIGGVAPKPGSDILISRGAAPFDYVLADSMAAANSVIELHASDKNMALIRPGSVLMVTDCGDLDIFSVSAISSDDKVSHAVAVSGGINNKSGSLSDKYQVGNHVLIMNPWVYFVAPSSVIEDRTGNKVNSLYKFSAYGSASADEMVPYIDDIQITYGLDLAHDDGKTLVTEYVTADQFTDTYTTNILNKMFPAPDPDNPDPDYWTDKYDDPNTSSTDEGDPYREFARDSLLSRIIKSVRLEVTVNDVDTGIKRVHRRLIQVKNSSMGVDSNAAGGGDD